MEFEFDIKKSLANKEKHGIDFVEAQALWEDINRLTVPANPLANDDRFKMIGVMANRSWAAIFAFRQGRTRLISVRPAREEEKRRYEEANEIQRA